MNKDAEMLKKYTRFWCILANLTQNGHIKNIKVLLEYSAKWYIIDFV